MFKSLTRSTFIALLCVFFLQAGAFAEESAKYFSIPDFTIHKVTPVKAVTQEQSPKKQETSAVKLRTDTPAQKEHPKKIAETPISQKTLQKVETSSEKIAPDFVEKSPVKQQEISSEKPPVAEAPKISPEDDVMEKINIVNEKVDAPSEKNYTNTAKETTNDFFKMIYNLGIVLALIVAFAWVYARVKGVNPAAILTGNFAEKDLNRFNVISSSTLGQGKDIHLVEINGKHLVIGSTSNNINLLTEMTPEEVEKLRQEKANAPAEDPIESLFPEIDEKQKEFSIPEVKTEIKEEKKASPKKTSVKYKKEETKDQHYLYKYLGDEDLLNANVYLSKYSEVYKDYLDNPKDK